MDSWKHCLSTRLLCGVAALCLAFATSSSPLEAQSTFPQYDHVFLIIMENEGYNQVVGNQYAPILNALASDYGIATNYTGVADPSEPNYVAMLGGDFFGISSDDPYWFPGQTVSADNLMSQLEGAGKTWRGYFQSMPYPGRLHSSAGSSGGPAEEPHRDDSDGFRPEADLGRTLGEAYSTLPSAGPAA